MTSAGRLHSRPSPTAPAAIDAGVHRVTAGDALLVVPRGRPAPRPLLVFFHGAGGDPLRSLPAVEAAAQAAGVMVVLPSSTGHTWDLLVGDVGPDVTGVDACLADVFDRHPVERVALGGFSDGASYALSLGLANGDLVSGLLAFSPGFVAPPQVVGRPPVWISHGTADTVLPVEPCGRQVVRRLTGAGYDVTYEEFDGGHVMTPRLVEAAFGWWLSR